jgi:hypothetical protein
MKDKLLKIYNKFQNKWIALDSTKENVLASGTDLDEVVNKLKQQKKTASELRYIIQLDRYYAPICQ